MRRTFCCVLVAGCLLLSGCGGESAPTASTSGSAGPPVPPSAGPPATPGAADGGGGPGAGLVGPPGPPGGSPDGAAPAPSETLPGGETPPSSPDGGLAGGGRFGGGRGFPGGEAGSPDGGGIPGPGYGEGGGGFPGIPDLSAFRPPVVKSLREQALDAFRANNETLGQQLLLTHFAIVPSAGSELGQKMAWIPALRRPALGPRIGIAALYEKPPRDFEGSPMPIGSSELNSVIANAQQQQQQQQGGEEGGRRRRGNNPRANAPGVEQPALGGGNPDPAAEGTGKGELFFHTGEFGTRLLEALSLRIASGDYGAIYSDLSGEISRPAQPADPNNPGADPNNPADLPGGSPDGGRGAPGGFRVGGLPGGIQPPGGNPDGGAGGEGAAAAAGPAQPLALGIVWLGKVLSKDEASRLAAEAQVDLLVTYEITVTIPKGGIEYVRNSTKIRITTVKKEEQLFASSALVNVSVAQAQAKAREGAKADDPVEKEITRAIEALDKACKAAPLPALTPEQVKGRLASLVAERPANPLPVLVEARYYVTKGLLPEADMVAAAVSLMGESEYARLIAKSPDAGMGQMVGSALSLPGLVDLLRGVNSAAGAAGMARRRPGGPQGGQPQDAAPGESPAPRRRGLGGLLPFGGSGR